MDYCIPVRHALCGGETDSTLRSERERHAEVVRRPR